MFFFVSSRWAHRDSVRVATISHQGGTDQTRRQKKWRVIERLYSHKCSTVLWGLTRENAQKTVVFDQFKCEKNYSFLSWTTATVIRKIYQSNFLQLWAKEVRVKRLFWIWAFPWLPVLDVTQERWLFSSAVEKASSMSFGQIFAFNSGN